MGKTGRWLKNFFTGKKDNTKEKKIREKSRTAALADDSSTANEDYSTTPITIPQPANPKEKGRWSFRRSSATAPRESNATDQVTASMQQPPVFEAKSSGSDDQQKQHALAVAAATAAAAADAAHAAAAAVIRLTASTPTATATATRNIMEEAAAIKIQSVFRSYLARKALKALRGLVKLQALARGHLVRKQAKATLRCMQTLVTLQAKVLARRRTIDDKKQPTIPTPLNSRSSTPNARSRQIYHVRYGMEGGDNRSSEENVKIVEMDVGEFRGSRKNTTSRNTDPSVRPLVSDQDGLPSPSTLSEFTPEMFSSHYDSYSYHKTAATAQSSPQIFPDSGSKYSESPFSYDYPLCPNYMANTESSRAKARSQSAPRQRPADLPHFERQPSSRRRPSVEGRSGVSLPRAVRMQRSSSNLSSTAAAQNFQDPWSLKLDRSAMSVRESECDSVCKFLTSTDCCRSLVGFDVAGPRKDSVVGARY